MLILSSKDNSSSGVPAWISEGVGWRIEFRIF